MRRVQRAWGRYRRHRCDLYDRPTAGLTLLVQILTAEAVETLLYECVTWIPIETYYRHHLHIYPYNTLKQQQRALSSSYPCGRLQLLELQQTIPCVWFFHHPLARNVVQSLLRTMNRVTGIPSNLQQWLVASAYVRCTTLAPFFRQSCRRGARGRSYGGGK